MRLEKADLNLFVVFDALYNEQSVTKVASKLNLTQPAISNTLNRLRALFDDQLFVRTPQGMQPTPVADNIIADVREALALLERTIASGARFTPASSEKSYRLGMNDMAEILLLPKLKLAISQEAPHVTLKSYYLERQSAVEDLKANALDFLLEAPVVNAKEFNHVSIAHMPYVVVHRPGHPCSGKRLTLNNYLAAEHVHVSSRRKGRGQVDIALHNENYTRTIAMRMQNYLVAAEVTRQTDLLWTAPQVIAEHTGLPYCSAPFTIEPLSWNLYWHKSAEQDPASIWMREKLQQITREIL